MSIKSPKLPVFLALDVKDLNTAKNLITQYAHEFAGFKIGFGLYLKTHTQLFSQIKNEGGLLFVDLKIHDIPNTCFDAARTLAIQGADFITVHALSGRSSIQAAVQGAAINPNTRVLAVTVLTSHNQQDIQDVGLMMTNPNQANSISAHVCNLAHMAMNEGVHGFICSAQEAPMLNQAFLKTPKKPVLICPGIRLLSHHKNNITEDQRRIMTPAQAIAAGADYLVIGRPIIDSPVPQEVLAEIKNQLLNM